MRKKIIYCLGTYVLLAQMLFSSILPCHAAQTGAGALPAEGGAETASKSYVLAADRSQISFGSLEQGSTALGQDIVLSNQGTEDISLQWREADYHDSISVDAPETDFLAAGESCVFTAWANTSLEPGIYNTFILFGDKEDAYFERGIQVTVSMEIKKPVPTAPAVTSISISPGTLVASKGENYTFTASVSGENDYSKEVAWSVSGQTGRNTFIDGNGILHVGSDETASSLVVKAVSRQDSRYSASALVSLQASSYFIQLKASPENGGAVYGSGAVKEGGYAVISAAPNNGFVFDGWYRDSEKISGNSQYVVDNIRGDGTYVAQFKPVNCRINVAVNNSNGGTATGSRTIGYGESITLEASAKDGYQFDGWMENGNLVSRDSKMQLNHVTDSRSFTAMFSQNRFSLSLVSSPTNAGTLSGQGTYQKGSDVRIKAAPARGYRFVGWTENGKTISTDQEYTVKDIARDMCLAAAFEREQAKTYTITAAASANGTITPEGKSTVAEGAWVLYAITPKSGYLIKNVYVDGKAIGATASYNFSQVGENHTISADFAPIPEKDKNNGGTAAETGTPEEKKTDHAGGTDIPGQDGEGLDEQMQAVEMNRLTGTLQYLNISVQEAERLIAENDQVELMKGALETGDLQVTIQNDFADTEQETSYSSFYENSGVPNFEIVLEHLLTTEEKMEMLQGNVPVSINLHIEDANGEEPPQVQKAFAENKLPGMNVGQYFEVFLMASKNSDTQMVSELPEALKVVINVPAHLRMENRKFYILRLHTKEDGSQDFAQLADEDDNPDTITFSTDKFSPYAIAYIDWQPESGEISGASEREPDNRRLRTVAGIVIVFLALAVTVTGISYIAGKKKQ
ncbi:MAG: InlB B-repeat-containing protein [Lachnospiraceae bacterium]|nr:InlB B-repeat-containing protein [Lachnospiraceae bacterium]